MAHSFVHYTCCLIVLTIFVDRGDGRWKKKDRENLQHDIDLFRKMADKIKHEIEDFYDEYSSKQPKEQVLDYRGNIEIDNINKNITWDLGSKSYEYLEFPTKLPQKYSNGQPKEIFHTNELTDLNGLHEVKDEKTKGPRWPKFEDILLEIGKRYDWKNDRWLKVKVKLKQSERDKISYNNIEMHEKHKFYYKMVKLNRSKNRRNVVVAVSAVR